jgi:hypothetical protein
VRAEVVVRHVSRAGGEGLSGQLAHDLCDIFGPTTSVEFDPSWRTVAVVALATRAYESRDFSVLPILGDALQDAGCTDAGILNHCRSQGVHVRGCFVADLVLGRS